MIQFYVKSKAGRENISKYLQLWTHWMRSFKRKEKINKIFEQ